jgi:ABC-2 type transport system permease protein
MRQLWGVMRKEFVHIRRDPRLVGYVVALPVVIVLLFGFALRLTVDDLTAVVWDQDKTFFSMNVKDRLMEKVRLNVVEVESEDAIRDALQRGNAHLGLVIPKGFSRRLANDQPTTFRLIVDGTMPTLAQAAMMGTAEITNDEAVAAILGDDEGADGRPPREALIKIEKAILFNPDMRDSDFFLPGTMGIVVMLVSLALATGLVREKEQQTIEQLWATPMSRVAFVAGKLIPYAIITTADFVLVAALSRVVFALPFRGSVLGVVALAAVFILAMLAMGSLIASLSETQLQQHFMNVFVFILSIMLSGFIFPLEAMPTWLQPGARLIPMTYFVEGVRALTLKASPLGDVTHDFVALGAFVLAFSALSLLGFRKQVG